MFRYFSAYKPYQVLTQFTSENNRATLADFFGVPKDVYPVGRLDADSEGLLLLTNDPSINHRLLNPRFAHEREYWVQVEGAITADAVRTLEQGLTIRINGKPWRTQPCRAYPLIAQPELPERNPPIRFRRHIPSSWLRLIITEGKNRQVRKMTAAIGFPTLRLVRYRIQNLELGHLQPGQMVEWEPGRIRKLLFE